MEEYIIKSEFYQQNDEILSNLIIWVIHESKDHVVE